MESIMNIRLENGSASYAEGRNLVTETGLPEDTQVELVETVSRERGTGYRDSIYRVCGTDDAIVIHHNSGPTDNIYWDRVEFRKKFFLDRREFAQKVGRLSNRYKIPFQVCLAIGDKEEIYPLFLAAVADVDDVCIKTIRNLDAGIDRRKAGLKAVLGRELYAQMDIENMGQKNSKRLAEYIAERCCGG